LGQLAAQVLALTGCSLQVVARHACQRDILARRGIAVVSEEDFPPGRADVVVEATGNPDGFELARKAVCPRGTVVLKSTYRGAVQTDFSALVVDEIRLVGSRCGPFEPALRLLAGRQVDPLPLVNAQLPLTQGIDAFAQANMPGIMKVLLKP
jgi:threonine dehydrogenase-like Zn-dependent dehydrogenase